MTQDADAFTRDEYAFEPKVTEAEIKHAVEFAGTWHGRADGRITVMMAPNMTINVSPDLLKASCREVDRLGLRLTTHCGWGEEGYAIADKLYGLEPLRITCAVTACSLLIRSSPTTTPTSTTRKSSHTQVPV